MNLQTQISFTKESKNLIDYTSKIILVGSCFSENIGEKFNYFKFQYNQNPFGILFHPNAIETFITNAINEKQYNEDDIFFLNERFHCFDAHSKFSNPSKEVLLSNLNKSIKDTNKQLKEASHIIITLGTSWIYRHIETDSYVANCHKVPQKKFLKELLTVEEIKESIESIIALIKDINSRVNFIFTISPVRHLKDGVIENQKSKSHLIAAIHQVFDPQKKCFYFPSYEIMMDELRDYRFYSEDMIHPNQTAINYIWEKFVFAWVSESSIPIMNKIDKIQKGLQHKPFNSQSNEYLSFTQFLKSEIKLIEKDLPHIKF